MGNVSNYTLFIICIFALIKDVRSQNLVLNGDLEATKLPLKERTYIERGDSNVIGWYNPGGKFSSPTILSYPNGNFRRRNFKRQYDIIPTSGNNFVGMWLFYAPKGTNYRDYIGGTLTSNLIAGKLYRICFKVALKSTSMYKVDKMHLCFFSQKISETDFNYCLKLKWNNEVHLDDVSNEGEWTSVVSYYRALGGEKYFIIGNFLDDSSTREANVVREDKRDDINLANYNVAGYFFDDFWISQVIENSDRTLANGMSYSYTSNESRILSDSIINVLKGCENISRIEIYCTIDNEYKNIYATCLDVKKELELLNFEREVNIMPVGAKIGWPLQKIVNINKKIIIVIR